MNSEQSFAFLFAILVLAICVTSLVRGLFKSSRSARRLRRYHYYRHNF